MNIYIARDNLRSENKLFVKQSVQNIYVECPENLDNEYQKWKYTISITEFVASPINIFTWLIVKIVIARFHKNYFEFLVFHETKIY
jgi:hypothetical protein